MRELHHENRRPICSAGTNVYVRDVRKAHQWYSEVLGLKMRLDPEGRFAEYSESWGKDERVPIFYLLPGLQDTGQHTTVSIALRASKLTELIAELKALDVKFERKLSREGESALESVTIVDPDGHGIVIYEY